MGELERSFRRVSIGVSKRRALWGEMRVAEERMLLFLLELGEVSSRV